MLPGLSNCGIMPQLLTFALRVANCGIMPQLATLIVVTRVVLCGGDIASYRALIDAEEVGDGAIAHENTLTLSKRGQRMLMEINSRLLPLLTTIKKLPVIELRTAVLRPGIIPADPPHTTRISLGTQGEESGQGGLEPILGVLHLQDLTTDRIRDISGPLKLLTQLQTTNPGRRVLIDNEIRMGHAHRNKGGITRISHAALPFMLFKGRILHRNRILSSMF